MVHVNFRGYRERTVMLQPNKQRASNFPDTLYISLFLYGLRNVSLLADMLRFVKPIS